MLSSTVLRRLPLFPKLAHHLFRREVEVNLGRGQAIVAQEALQGRQRDAFLDRRDREGVAQHVGGHRPRDTGAIGDTLHEELHRPGRQANGILECKMVGNEGLQAGGERDDAPLRTAAVGTAFAVDRQPLPLPVDLRRGEARQLRDPQAGIQEGLDDELLPHRLAGLRQAGRFLGPQGLALELVGHHTTSAQRPGAHAHRRGQPVPHRAPMRSSVGCGRFRRGRGAYLA
jgi:hypothetical protein